MFEQLGRIVFRLRFLIVLAWLAAAVAVHQLAPSLATVGSADQSSFLPSDAESSQAEAALNAAFPAEASAATATIAFSRPGGLADADRTYIADVATWLTSAAPASVRDVVKSVTGAAARPELASRLQSSDGVVELLQVQLGASSFQPRANDAVAGIRTHLAQTEPTGLQANVTGTVGIGADYLSAINSATDRTTLVTIVLVILVLLLIYRAPLAALVPLLTIGAAYLVAGGLLGALAQAGWRISSLISTFTIVLVFGVGTDYTIFLISRFREEVAGRAWPDAIAATERRIGTVITASAATVIVGLGSMVVGRFVMFQTTGPALALTIAVTLFAGLTLAPALMSIFGHYLFWPRHERDGAAVSDRSLFTRLAAVIAHRPGLVTIVVIACLLVPAAAVPSLRQSFDVLADLPAGTDSKAGFDVVAAHFDEGRLLPVTVIVATQDGSSLTTPAALAAIRRTTDALLATPGVQHVESVMAPTGDGTTPDAFRPSVELRTMAASLVPSGDPASALRRLASAETSAGLASTAAYVAALGKAYPDVASTDGFRAVVADLGGMQADVASIRSGARVATQLGVLAARLRSPGAGTSPGQALTILSGYLAELAAAYPAVATMPATADLRAALISSAAPPDPARIATDLGSLQAAFASQPDALLFPRSLPASADAARLQADVAAVGSRLPGEMAALATAFGARSDDYFVPEGLGSASGPSVAATVAAYVSTGRDATRIYVTVTADPYSPAAFDTVTRVRAAMASATSFFPSSVQAHTGGATSSELDLQTTINADFLRVAGLTVLGVLLVLIVLLRSLVAPLYLVGTVLLSYAGTLGLTSWFFQNVLGQAGLNYFLPLMVFVLLVALGSDYNIFLMSRVREESESRGTRLGIQAAAGRTGAVITSAGVILAGTFLAMIASPLTVLFQVGVVVAVGVLVDTFIVRSLLVPAITTLLGDRAWWPFGQHGAATGSPPPVPGAVARRP